MQYVNRNGTYHHVMDVWDVLQDEACHFARLVIFFRLYSKRGTFPGPWHATGSAKYWR